MARQTVLAKESVKLSDAEKDVITADKLAVRALTSGDISRFDNIVSRLNDVRNVLKQEGNMVGKRFSGAASHDFADNCEAYAKTVTRGAIARIA